MFQEFGSLIDHAVKAAFDDFLFAHRFARYAHADRFLGDELLDFWVALRCAVALVQIGVAIPAFAALLAQSSQVAELHDHVVPAAVGGSGGHLRFARLVAHIVASHIMHRKNAHCIAEFFQCGVHLVWQRAVFNQEVRFAGVVAKQCIANKTGIDSRQHRNFSHASTQVHQRCDHIGCRFGCANHFQQPHHMRRTEEVCANNVRRTRCHCCNLVHIQAGCVGGQNGAGLGQCVEFAEYVLLEGHVLEHGLNYHIGILHVGDLHRADDQCQAQVHLGLAQFATRDAAGIVVLDTLQTAFQPLVAGID